MDLAAGKGVSICKSRKEVLQISKEIFLGKFKSSNKIILEEYLCGEEVSYFLIVDKKILNFLVRFKTINAWVKKIKV